MLFAISVDRNPTSSMVYGLQSQNEFFSITRDNLKNAMHWDELEKVELNAGFRVRDRQIMRKNIASECVIIVDFVAQIHRIHASFCDTRNWSSNFQLYTSLNCSTLTVVGAFVCRFHLTENEKMLALESPSVGLLIAPVILFLNFFFANSLSPSQSSCVI